MHAEIFASCFLSSLCSSCCSRKAGLGYPITPYEFVLTLQKNMRFFFVITFHRVSGLHSVIYKYPL